MDQRMVFSLLLLVGCGGGGDAPPVFSVPVVPATCPSPLDRVVANPTFAAHVLPAIQTSCGSSTVACHGGTGVPSGHILWATFSGRTAAQVRADLVDVAPSNAPAGWKRVAPGDPERSWLLEKLSRDCPGGTNGNCFGHRMPLGAPNACPELIENLRTWIRNGAPL